VDSVDLSELISDEVATHRDRAARRGVRILVSGEPAQRCVVDSRRLRRALRELVDNALTYAPDDSTVRVASTTSAAGIRISVSDEGDGIDSDDRTRVARPFERGTHPRRPATGQGMGLALAAAVASWHGGRLVLSGGPGRGFQACIRLPRRGRGLR
jgi:signal transduction histidine kinase